MTQRHIPEERRLQLRCCERRKSRKFNRADTCTAIRHNCQNGILHSSATATNLRLCSLRRFCSAINFPTKILYPFCFPNCIIPHICYVRMSPSAHCVNNLNLAVREHVWKECDITSEIILWVQSDLSKIQVD